VGNPRNPTIKEELKEKFSFLLEGNAGCPQEAENEGIKEGAVREVFQREEP